MKRTKAQKKVQNGYRFPIDVKAATVAELGANPTKRRSEIAAERNMSVATVKNWAGEAGITLPNHQHPNTAAAVKARWAAYAVGRCVFFCILRCFFGVCCVVLC